MDQDLKEQLLRIEKKIDALTDSVAENRLANALNRAEVIECRKDTVANALHIAETHKQVSAHTARFAWLSGLGVAAGGAAGWLSRLLSP